MFYNDEISKQQELFQEKSNLVTYTKDELATYKNELSYLEQANSAVSQNSPRAIAIESYKEAIAKTEANLMRANKEAQEANEKLYKYQHLNDKIVAAIEYNQKLAAWLDKNSDIDVMRVRDEITKIFKKYSKMPASADNFKFHDTLSSSMNTSFALFDESETDDIEDIDDTVLFGTTKTENTVERLPDSTVLAIPGETLTKQDFGKLSVITLKAIAASDDDLNDDSNISEITEYLENLNMTQEDLDELVQHPQVQKYIKAFSFGN